MNQGNAEFTVKLVDKVTRPAKSAGKAVDDLEQKLSKGTRGTAERQTRQEERARAKIFRDQERAAKVAERQLRQEERARLKVQRDQERSSGREEQRRSRDSERFRRQTEREARRGEALRFRGADRASRLQQRVAMRNAKGLQRNDLQNMRSRERMRKLEAQTSKRAAADQVKAAEKFEAASTSGAAVLAGAAIAATAAVGLLAYKVESAAHESAIFAQNTDLAFRQLAKHGVDGSKLFEHVRAEAQSFGLDVKETTKQYTKFLALQFTPKEADKLVAMGADLRALGNDAEGVSGIFTALGQIKSKGRLQGEELLQLSERGISSKLVQEAIGEKLGKTQDEVAKLQQAGKITADIALPAIEVAINRKLNQQQLGDTGKRFADTTIAGAEGKLKANWDNLWLGLGQRTEKSFGKLAGGLVERLTAWVNSDNSTQFMDTWGKRVDRLNEGIGNAVTLAERLGSGFDKGSQDAQGIVGLLDKLGGDGFDLGQASTKAEQLGRALGFVTSTALATAGAIELAGSMIWDGFAQPIIDTVSEVSDAFGAISTIWQTDSLGWISKAELIGGELISSLGTGILKTIFFPITITKGMVDTLLEHFNIKDRFYEAGSNLLKGFGEGMLRALPGVGGILGSALDLIKDKPKEELDMHSPSRVFDRYGGWTMEGFGGGVERKSHVAARAAGDAARESTAAFHAGLGLQDGPSFRLGGIAANTRNPSPEIAFSAPRESTSNVQLADAPIASRSGRLQVDLNLRVSVDGASPLDVQIGEAAVERLEPLLESIFERYLEAG